MDPLPGDSSTVSQGGAGVRPEVEVPPGAVIAIESGFYEGLEVCMDRDWLVIGRGRSADVVLAEATISRSHAAIGYEAEGFFVQDLGSTNGTSVNGSRIERTRLKDRDSIQMGKLVLGVTLPS
jgi:predicted component of type VI protein secretion system